MHQDPTQRFSSRVENYLKYRPRYPPAILDLLRRECGLTSETVIADIGSGTGFLAELFLRAGSRVFGVEPNREMREAGERLLQGYPAFRSVAASAEATGLPTAGVDMVVAGQAYHWFDQQRARAEFERILRPPGWVVLVWNNRRTSSSPFLQAYEQLLHRYGRDYAQVTHKDHDQARLGHFFAPGSCAVATLENVQQFDLEGLTGRLLSSSYTPEPGDPSYQPMLAALRQLFEAHHSAGLVRFEYDTEVYYGQLSPA